MLKKILEYIERNINLEQKESSKKEIISALNYKNERKIITYENAPQKFKALNYSETFNNMENMLYNELVPIANNISANDDMIYSIRTNYGVGTLPSLFGAKSSLLNETAMPWCEHFSKEHLLKLLDKGIPNLDCGFGRKILETYEYYNEIIEKYPNAKKGIALFHPDLQGPFDVAHLLFGSDIYMELYDDPNFVHDLLRIITNTYIKYLKKIISLIGNEFDGYCYHWNTIYKGDIVLRNDSAISLSPPMYREFSMAYDDIIAKEFKTLGMHYCGQNEAWLPIMLKEADIKSLNFGYVPSKTYGQEFLKTAKELSKERKIPIINYRISKEELQNIQEKDLISGTTFWAY
jgi:hypothetical protein